MSNKCCPEGEELGEEIELGQLVFLQNENVARLAEVMDRLVERYPGRSILDIIWDAGNFTGRSAGLMRHMSSSDMLDRLERYLNTHD
jgi:hypothetical protein